MSETVKEREKCCLLYLGPTVDHKGKLKFRWAEVRDVGDELPGEDKIRHYPGPGRDKNIADAVVGTVWEFECERGEDNTLTVFMGGVNPPVCVGMWTNEEQVTLWQIEARARLDAYNAAKRMKSATSRKFNLEVLDPFRRTYSRLSPTERAQLIRLVVQYIAGGKIRD